MTARAELTSKVAAFEGGARDTVAFLRTRMHEQPVATLLAGGVTGWVLGGGLTPRTMAFLAQVAGRMLGAGVVAALVRDVEPGRRTQA